MPRRTMEELERWLVDNEQGMRQKAIAEREGLHPSRVQTLLVQAWYNRQYAKDAEKIRAYAGQFTAEQIVDDENNDLHYNWPAQIKYIAKKFNIPLKPSRKNERRDEWTGVSWEE